jgi:hypothetical protein
MGQSVAAQVAALKAAGSREVASGAKTDRAQLRRVIAALEAAGDVLFLLGSTGWRARSATC